MKSIYWHWAENILEKEPYNLKERTNDLFLVDVNLGLDNYGYIKEYNAMEKIKTQKK